VITLYRWQKGGDFIGILRGTAFHVISFLTTTGYTTEDYMVWGYFPLMILFLISMVGGCTGSTSGGIKIFRYQIAWSVAQSHLNQLRYPHGIFVPLLNGRQINHDVLSSVFTFFVLFFISFSLMFLGLSFFDLDMMTSLSASLAALNNVGASFGDIVGPKGFWGDLHPGAKWILIMGMIVGRLEYITFVILFKRTFWRD
jgi:trk system potassium uptake protein TrkH